MLGTPAKTKTTASHAVYRIAVAGYTECVTASGETQMRETTDNVRELFESNADQLLERCKREGHYGIRSGYYGDGADAGEAVKEMTRRLSDAVEVTADDHVLDAGCGFGDCLLWLAERRDATGVGVDIAAPQIETARELADERGVTDAVSFRRESYHDLGASGDETFDVVWALESLMHTDDPRGALEGFADRLAPGGRLVVCEPFTAGTLSPAGQSQLEQMESGNEASIDEIEAFCDDVRAAGFGNVERTDITGGAAPGVRRRSLVARWLFKPAARLGNLVGLVDDRALSLISGTAAAGKLITDDSMRYYIVTARRDGACGTGVSDSEGS